MKRLLLLCWVALILLLVVGTAAASPAEQTTGASITSFTTTATLVDRAQLAARTARIPVSWTTLNRPNSANLVFEQILPDGRVMNVELPRQNPYVASNGNGTAAPFPPGEGVNEIVLRLSLRDAVTVYDQEELRLPIGDAPVPTAEIRTFETSISSVIRSTLADRTARVPVGWAVVNRPENSNLVFEQVLADGSSVNVELPRTVPIVPSEGLGVAAPVTPGGTTPATSITLRVRLVNLSNNTTITQKDLSVPISEGTQTPPLITAFTTTATSVNRAQLTARTARVPVSWIVDNRPLNSNLVFEQILADNSVVNVELPRQNPFVTSSGSGTAAPVAPGGTATSITLRLRVIDLTTQATLAEKQITLPIDETVITPNIRAFTASVTSVRRAELTARTARIPVSWIVDNRPPNSNLVFEQVLADNSVVNVELPRSVPIVPSEGVGVAAPVPPGGTATSITLRLRVIDLTTQATLAEKSVTLTIDETVIAPTIRTFTTSATAVDRAQLSARTARVPVSWIVDNRPPNSNLVFEQVLDNNSVINVELPRQNPIVSSSGDGVASPAAPTNAATTTITLRLRVIDLTTQATLVEQSLNLNISTVTTAPTIRTFSTTMTSIERTTLASRTARVPVSWAVDNRPPNSNLVFEQVLDNGTVVNVELPRSVPIVPSSGNGTAAPVEPGNAASTTITLRLRVIDLTTQATLAQREIPIPIGPGGGTLPPITGVTAIFQRGQGLGNRANVFSKVGDSLTDTPNFLREYQYTYNLRDYGSLQPVIQYFSQAQALNANSFGSFSIASRASWSSVNVLDPASADASRCQPGETPLACEYRVVKPAFVIILIGTNDLPAFSAEQYAARLKQMIDISIDRGVVPLLTTLPPRPNLDDKVNAYNQVIRSFATQYNVPLIDLHTTLAGRGVDADGVHLSAPPNAPASTVDFTAANLAYGATLRNLITLQALDAVWRQTTGGGGGLTEDRTPETTPEPVSGEPVVIQSFTVAPDPADRNGAVTISWEVTGGVASVSIGRLSEMGGAFVETILTGQPAAGSQPYTLPGDYINTASFLLSATDASGQESIRQVDVLINCPFASSLTADCPITQTPDIVASYQPFERGAMLYRGDERKIYVLFGDGSVQAYDDTWTPGDPGDAPGGEPPPVGLFQPVAGFGKVFNQIGGFSVLGWATAEETPYAATWETHQAAGGETQHATLPDGRTAHLETPWRIE